MPKRAASTPAATATSTKKTPLANGAAPKRVTAAPPSVLHNKLFVDNKFVDAVEGEVLETINPSTGEVICQVAAATAADVDLAVEAAERAFAIGSEWCACRLARGAPRLTLWLMLGAPWTPASEASS